MPTLLVDIIAVGGGLGLFFLGMKFMGDGLELAAGAKLRTLLEKITSNLYLGMLVGLVVTAVIQSSSATASMVVGFTNAGLMELAQTAGILFGSKIGTCMTSVLLSFDIKEIIPLVILVGVCIWMFSKRNNVKHIAMIFAGFGILFYGMTVMSQSLGKLNETGLIDDLLSSVESPWLGLLVGTVITAIIQSSSASVGILMALAMATNMDLKYSIFIIYGMNLGACMPAFLAAIGTRRQAKQVAILNLIITFFGVVLLVPLTMLLPIADTIKNIVPNAPGVQVSIAHIFFNVANMLILMPFSSLMVKLTQKILPIDEDQERDKMKTEYIDDLLLSAPPMAVLQCEKEVQRLTRMVNKNYNASLDAFFNKDKKQAMKVLDREKVIDYLCHAITKYIIKINGLDIEDHDRKVVAAMYSALQDLERIGDYAENLVEFAQQCEERRIKFSSDAMGELKKITDISVELMDKGFQVFIDQKATPQQVQEILLLEDVVDDCKDEYKANHIRRMNANICSGEAGVMFLNMLTDVERVGDHIINVAFVMPGTSMKVAVEKSVEQVDNAFS